MDFLGFERLSEGSDGLWCVYDIVGDHLALACLNDVFWWISQNVQNVQSVRSVQRVQRVQRFKVLSSLSKAGAKVTGFWHVLNNILLLVVYSYLHKHGKLANYYATDCLKKKIDFFLW